MSKEMGPVALVAVVAIAVLVLGLWTWRTFGATKAPSVSQEQKLMQHEEAIRRLPRGGTPAGYLPGR
jgi:hypothetical protein